MHNGGDEVIHFNDAPVVAPAGQAGSVLLLVLAVVLMLSISVLAILNMTTSTGKVANNLEIGTKNLQRMDGAFEQAVNSNRNDATLCPGTQTFDGFDIECQSVGTSTDSRTMDFLATKAGTTEPIVGKTRVFVTDKVNGQTNIGYSIVVCDWLLGSAMVNENLKGCS